MLWRPIRPMPISVRGFNFLMTGPAFLEPDFSGSSLGITTSTINRSYVQVDSHLLCSAGLTGFRGVNRSSDLAFEI